MAVQGASLQPIYSRLNAVEEENPGSAVTFSDWSMQAGDTVTITRDGKEYKSTVHSSTLVWKGKAPTVTINSNGEEHHKSVANKSKDKFGRGGSGLRASENAYWSMVTSYNNMTSGLILASSSAALYVDNKYTQMSSGLKLTSSSAALYVDNKYTQMSSGLKLTSSSAALYVDNKYTQMSSGLKLTSSSAALYVDNKYTQMSSGLKLTSSSAALYVDNKYTQMSSGLKLTSSSAALYVDNKYTQMSSGLKLTSSSAALYVDNKYTQMSSGLKLTSSSAALYVDNKYTQMSSGLKLTSSSAALYVDNKYTQMSSGLKLTSSSAALYVDNKYAQMKAGLDITSSSAALYVDNKYTQMSSGLKLTSSSAALYVDNKYTQMSSGLKLTSSSAALYVDNKYTQMSSGLNMSSSSAALYVDNKYTQMSSGLKLTSSSAALYVDNKYTQMSSGLNMSSSSAALYVDNKYTQMTAGLKLTSSSAALYTENRTTRAYIMTRINADGEGEALIEADKVKITGTTKLNDVMTVTNNAVGFSKPAIFSDDVSINSSGELNVYTINLKGSTDVSLDKFVMSDVIIKAAVVNSELRLWKMGDDKSGNPSITFSKAVSSLTVEGGDGQIKVTPQPQNTPRFGINVRVYGDSTITSNGTYTYKVQYEDENDDYWDTGATKTVTVNVPPTAEIAYNGQTEPSGISGLGDLGTISPNHTYDWYIVTAKAGSSTKPYKMKVSITDSNFKASNIKSGVTILGVTGTYSPSIPSPTAELSYNGQSEPTGISGLGDLGTISTPDMYDWYIVTAKSGTSTKPYKLKVDATAKYNSGYEDGWKAGWNAYNADSSDWISAYGTGATKYVYRPRKQGTGGQSANEYDYWNSPHGRGKGNGSSDTCAEWFQYTPGSTGPTNHTGFYIIVTQNQGGSKTVTASVTYPASSSVPSGINKDGQSIQLYWY